VKIEEILSILHLTYDLNISVGFFEFNTRYLYITSLYSVYLTNLNDNSN